jgi:hypothetical protein
MSAVIQSWVRHHFTFVYIIALISISNVACVAGTVIRAIRVCASSIFGTSRYSETALIYVAAK